LGENISPNRKKLNKFKKVKKYHNTIKEQRLALPIDIDPEVDLAAEETESVVDNDNINDFSDDESTVVNLYVKCSSVVVGNYVKCSSCFL
jgi:hypothetical protein